MVPRQGDDICLVSSLLKGYLLLEIGWFQTTWHSILGLLVVPSGTLLAEYIAILSECDFQLKLCKRKCESCVEDHQSHHFFSQNSVCMLLYAMGCDVIMGKENLKSYAGKG